MKRRILSAVCLAMIPSMGVSADDPRCCFSMAAYANETARERPCNDPFGHMWFCPQARAHYPEQHFCNAAAEYASSSKKCFGTRPPVNVPMLDVLCGTFFQQCIDGPPSGLTVPASNDLCAGNCTDRGAVAGACSHTAANEDEAVRIATRQNEELEALLAPARELKDAEAAQLKDAEAAEQPE